MVYYCWTSFRSRGQWIKLMRFLIFCFLSRKTSVTLQQFDGTHLANRFVRNFSHYTLTFGVHEIGQINRRYEPCVCVWLFVSTQKKKKKVIKSTIFFTQKKKKEKYNLSNISMKIILTISSKGVITLNLHVVWVKITLSIHDLKSIT